MVKRLSTSEAMFWPVWIETSCCLWGSFFPTTCVRTRPVSVTSSLCESRVGYTVIPAFAASELLVKQQVWSFDVITSNCKMSFSAKQQAPAVRISGNTTEKEKARRTYQCGGCRSPSLTQPHNDGGITYFRRKWHNFQCDRHTTVS